MAGLWRHQAAGLVGLMGLIPADLATSSQGPRQLRQGPRGWLDFVRFHTFFSPYIFLPYIAVLCLLCLHCLAAFLSAGWLYIPYSEHTTLVSHSPGGEVLHRQLRSLRRSLFSFYTLTSITKYSTLIRTYISKVIAYCAIRSTNA